MEQPLRGLAPGKIVRETKVASEPEVLVAFFRQLGVPVTRIGLEADPLSQWLHAGLTKARFEVVLLEARPPFGRGGRGGSRAANRDQRASETSGAGIRPQVGSACRRSYNQAGFC
jgi:hypothetical protein